MLNKNKLPKKNVADAIDETAKRISDSLYNNCNLAEWDQEKIGQLKLYDGKVGLVPINLIQTKNIRHTIDENSSAQEELKASIEKHGILQPPIITVITDNFKNHNIILVAGERRLRAAISLGYKTINCMVRIFHDKEHQMTASMSENINRKELDPLDIANCFLSLSEQGYKYIELQKMFGYNEKTIGRYIKIARWPEKIQQIIRENCKKFTIKYLFSLASRTLDDELIVNELNNYMSSKKNKTTRISPKIIYDYLSIQSYKEQEVNLIVKVLTDLNIMQENDILKFKEGLIGFKKTVDKKSGDTVSPNCN